MVDKKLEDMAWDDDALHRIFLQCGMYSVHRNKVDEAKAFFEKALQLKPDDYISLYEQSRCKRKIADTESALKDATMAMDVAPESQPVKLEVCDALFELNLFEENYMNLHTYARQFKDSAKVNAFYEREIVVEETLGTALGDSLLRFFMENEQILNACEEEYQRRIHIPEKPQWKILRDEGKCDIFSVLLTKQEVITPCERKRRELAFKLFVQIYLNKNWSDFIFLTNLLSVNQALLLLPQARDSTPFLKKFIETKNKIIWKFLKMLHTRGPIYSKQAEKCPIPAICERQREAHLFRVQYETRRRMFIVLRSIKKFREEGNLKDLSICVQDTVCNFFLLKTRRVLCWKFVFINEVLNVFALAHLDQYQVLKTYAHIPDEERVRYMFGFKQEKQTEFSNEFIFGDKSTFQDFTKFENKLKQYRSRVSYLEDLKKFFQYPIIRAYMDFEIARLHLQQNRIDECCKSAHKSIIEAEEASNNAWRVLGLMLTAKGHAKFDRVERLHETLTEAKIATQHIKSTGLQEFVSLAYETNSIGVKEKANRHQSAINSLSSRRSLKTRSFGGK